MKRTQAEILVDDAVRARRSNGVAGRASDLVAALEGLGLLQIEEPEAPALRVPALSWSDTRGAISALIREDTLVETLRRAGYEVTKR